MDRTVSERVERQQRDALGGQGFGWGADAFGALQVAAVACHAERAGLDVAVRGLLGEARLLVFGAQVGFGHAAVDVVPRQRFGV